jgi:beta-lactamase class D
MKWDGVERWRDSWNRDQTLQMAMRYSTVWYFQSLARSLGDNVMQRYLDRFGYGNRDISSGIDTFWLNGSIEISAIEQIEFLRKLYRNQLPLKVSTMKQVRELLVLEAGDKGVFSGKTGTGWDPETESFTHGWFVGHLASIHGNYVFALNIQDGPKAWGPEAKKLTRQILAELDLFASNKGEKPAG